MRNFVFPCNNNGGFFSSLVTTTTTSSFHKVIQPVEMSIATDSKFTTTPIRLGVTKINICEKHIHLLKNNRILFLPLVEHIYQVLF